MSLTGIDLKYTFHKTRIQNRCKYPPQLFTNCRREHRLARRDKTKHGKGCTVLGCKAVMLVSYLPAPTLWSFYLRFYLYKNVQVLHIPRCVFNDVFLNIINSKLAVPVRPCPGHKNNMFNSHRIQI